MSSTVEPVQMHDVEADDGLDDRTYVIKLFDQHYLALVRLAVHLVDDQETAEDVVQDVYASLGNRRPNDPASYLRWAVVNRSRSALRRRRTARRTPAFQVADAEPADGPALRREQQLAVLAVIAQLPRRQREIVVLRYYQDLSVPEVAAVLRITPGAVSSSLLRAHTTLTRLLGEI
ncbi:RNA polymerase sigma factor (sigma-70 family) [Nakamurella sp. UYEF19]|uniref:RNA polymerase sigma factor n=1 Tax=Nakamurella sp. UYEF19 TaxID=1756392 RepID=UPI003395A0AE